MAYGKDGYGSDLMRGELEGIVGLLNDAGTEAKPANKYGSAERRWIKEVFERDDRLGKYTKAEHARVEQLLAAFAVMDQHDREIAQTAGVEQEEELEA